MEAWPRAVNYWEKDGRVLGAGSKYQIGELEQQSQYKFLSVFSTNSYSFATLSAVQDTADVPAALG